MMITLVAVLCQIASGSCVEELIPDAPNFMACQLMAQQVIAERMSQSETYSSGWRLDRYKCVIGRYTKAQAL